MISMDKEITGFIERRSQPISEDCPFTQLDLFKLAEQRGLTEDSTQNEIDALAETEPFKTCIDAITPSRTPNVAQENDSLAK